MSSARRDCKFIRLMSDEGGAEGVEEVEVEARGVEGGSSRVGASGKNPAGGYDHHVSLSKLKQPELTHVW